MSGVGRGIPRPWHKAEYDRKRESSRYLLLKYYLGRMDYQRAMVYFILCSACLLNFHLPRCHRSTMPPHRLPLPPCRLKIYPARNIWLIGTGHTSLPAKAAERNKIQIRYGAVMPYTVQMKEVNFGYIPGHGACRQRNFSGSGTFQAAELFRRRNFSDSGTFQAAHIGKWRRSEGKIWIGKE